MSRYIDADKIIFHEIDEIGGEYEPYLGCSKKQIDDIKTADVQPVIHAKWLSTERYRYADGSPVFTAWVCSNCGSVFECEYLDFHYCPRCGAYMDLKEHKDETDN